MELENSQFDPLLKSEKMKELSQKLDLLERMRHVCNSVDIAIPGIVVVGEQSAGKSSLLENISGIQFPRAQNTCTRMPCVLTMVIEDTPEPYALVSMSSSFHDVTKCTLKDVDEKIKSLTDEHAKGDAFISSDPASRAGLARDLACGVVERVDCTFFTPSG